MKKQNEIIITNKATVNGNGNHTNGNCKQVVCLENMKFFTSVMDAAEYAGVTYSAMSACCRGKIRTCNGKKFCFLGELPMYLNSVAEKFEANAEKAKAYDAVQAEQEARRKEEEKLLADYEKLNAIETNICNKITALDEKRNSLVDEVNNVCNRKLEVAKILWEKFGKEMD